MGNSCVGDSRPLAEDGRVVISEPVCEDSTRPNEAIADLEPTVFTKVDAAPPEGERPQELTLKEPTEEACGSYVAPSTISRIVGDGICAICLEPLRNQAQTIALCGHIFHRDCINKCGSAFCPQCRHLIDKPAGGEGREDTTAMTSGLDGPLSAGVRVVLCGLRRHVERNGLHALVVQHLSGNGSEGNCYTVRTIDGAQLFRVHEDNLLVMAPTDADAALRSARSMASSLAAENEVGHADAALASGAGFQPGTVVELCGLQVAQQFNGQTAEVLSNYSAHGRHEVRLYSDGSIKVVRNENLRLLVSASTPTCGVMTVNEFIAHAKRCRLRGIEVTKLELTAWARYLGIDPSGHPDLVWIAYEALKAPLPPEWSEHYDSDGRVYYFNMTTRVSSWTHPLEEVHRYVYQRLSRCRRSELTESDIVQEVCQVQQWCEDAIKEAERELQVWTEHADERGDRFYFNREQRRSNWGNPRPALLHKMYLHKNALKVLACFTLTARSDSQRSEELNGEDQAIEVHGDVGSILQL
mmetsp:Transcript_48591/g.113785  ORF Transcript_48591/g.113785 Transcript_48591/m.113785 type:complete len:526 (+) Transcript_48591:167-1744(+)